MRMNELVKWFQENYPNVVSDMMNSSHHLIQMDKILSGECGTLINTKTPISLNPFHLEGDVWTHTMMVCNQAENTSKNVMIAALLHDIGKPSARFIKNNKVCFYNHDQISAFMALEILKTPFLNLHNEDIIQIFNIIALHTQVFKQDHKKLCNSLDNFPLAEQLMELGKCDHSGRFHKSTPNDFFRPSMEKVLKWSTENSKTPKSDFKKEVIILCGLPGSGKTTWVEQYKINNPDCFIISRDSIITDTLPELSYNEAFNQVDQKLVDKELQLKFNSSKNKNSVVVDMTHMSKKSRRSSLGRFGKDYKKTCIMFLSDLETIKYRNNNRIGKNIKDDIIFKMVKSFYPPTKEEFDEIRYVVV